MIQQDRLRTEAPAVRYRSGAVARMLRMPVATLRVWERRYRVTDSPLSAGGQRMYSVEDVRRLALLRQLTELGHAIGSLAGLDYPQLQAVAATHGQALARPQPTPAVGDRVWHVAVVGAGLAARLKRPTLAARLGRPLAVLGPFDDVAQAVEQLQAHGRVPDALWCHEPSLHDGWLDALDAARAQAPWLADVPKAVLYGFASDAVCDRLAAAGIALLRDPQPDAVLAQWLGAHEQPPAASRAAPEAAPALIPPRRWDDATLADVASLSSTIACECPRHVAELLMQLSHFEDYSKQCESRSEEDAELHADLYRIAAAARAQFESALERVAQHEGLMLPR